jgi:protoporphyrinogen oxidase
MNWASVALHPQFWKPVTRLGEFQNGELSRLSFRHRRPPVLFKVPLINDLWHEILEEDFLLRPRLSRIYYNNHFFSYPLKPLNALAGLGPTESLLVGLSYLKAQLVHIHDERTFEQWVSNRFGYRLYDIFFKTYTEKVWGIPCAEISADWAAQRIKICHLRKPFVMPSLV